MFGLSTKRQKHFDGTVTCGCISCFAVLVRLLCKRRQKAGIRADDYTIIAGLIFYLVSVSVTLWGSITGAPGGGMEIADIAMSARKNPEILKSVERYLESVFLGFTFYLPALYCIKLSILLFYRQIFFVKIGYQRASLVMIVISTAWIIAAELASLLTCQPVDAFWLRTKPGKCINFNVKFLGTTLVEIIIDIIIFILPFRVAFQLQMPIRTKVAVGAIFALGGISIITNVIRLYYSYRPGAVYVNLAETEVWANVHAVTAIISACLPLCKPLWNYICEATGYVMRLFQFLLRARNNNASGSRDGISKLVTSPAVDDSDVMNYQGVEWLVCEGSKTTSSFSERSGEVDLELPPFPPDRSSRVGSQMV